ncbi:pentapeptide repeat-containing protein [Actinomadura syzygii]|uniref:pentapeptide repeat-containing protein n=1 Tax=Actinomadura syzygii TaxID=1427538 RepID=UPI001652B3EA|nr:pentapeptide repeat-containing protein [Actinomadura syzygii]
MRLRPPGQAELDAIPADRRLELLDLERQHHDRELQRQERARQQRTQSRHQWFNSVGILASVLFTAAGLVATALTLQAGQDELRTSKESQITDRYTRAAEQLGSTKPEVRTAAIYALERIAADSTRDHYTIRSLLAAFVREHDPSARVKAEDLPPEPAIDVTAALDVVGRQPVLEIGALDSAGLLTVARLDLHAIRIPRYVSGGYANWRGALLRNADLHQVSLTFAHLTNTDLRNANLHEADLREANLSQADLRDAKLSGANLGVSASAVGDCPVGQGIARGG